MTTLENLLRTSEGDFDYNKIDSESLSDLALQESDPVAATSALGELTLLRHVRGRWMPVWRGAWHVGQRGSQRAMARAIARRMVAKLSAK